MSIREPSDAQPATIRAERPRHENWRPGRRSDARTPRRARATSLAWCLLLVAACSAPAMRPGTPRFGDWRGMPTGWDKLERIDRWLSTSGTTAATDDRLAAQLELAEGRVELTLLDGNALDARVREIRLELAVNGFEAVLDDPLAGEQTIERAEEGLRQAERMGFVLTRPEPKSASRPESIAGVIPRASWGAAPTRSNVDPADGRWEKITVHHTAMPAAHLARGGQAASAAELRSIQQIHQTSRRWADIGYHYLIDPAGRVFEGRSMQWQGAHAGRDQSTGRNFNPRNIGICLLGNFEIERPTAAAIAALEALIEDLQRRHRIPRNELWGHEHFKSTECPGRNLASWLSRYKLSAARTASAASASSSSSSEILGSQPSARSRDGSPTTASMSSLRVRAGSDRVR